MSPAWPLSLPADSLHFATVLIVLAISVGPQPPGLSRILFSECATFCYFVLAMNAGHPYQCGCLALGTRIGARVAFQGRMIVDPRLGTNHAAEVGAGPDRPVMRACRSGSERSDWKKRNQSRRAIGIAPDHSSSTCCDLAIPSVQIIAETGLTYTGLVSSFAGSGHTVLDSPTAQSLTPGDFLDAIASADLVEPDQLASMNRRGNLGPGSRTRTLHTSSSTS